MGLRNVREPMKVVTMTKVPANETAEQIRSVMEIANNCVWEGDMVTWS